MKQPDSYPCEMVPASDADVTVVLTWFNSQRELLYWGGPDLDYPLTLADYKTAFLHPGTHSFVLKSTSFASEVLAFGQIYLRLERIHLGRLVVSPQHRGQGLGRTLVQGLWQQGQRLFGHRPSSLFVLDDNRAALHLYQQLGYKLATYPTPLKLDNCLFMIRPLVAPEN